MSSSPSSTIVHCGCGQGMRLRSNTSRRQITCPACGAVVPVPVAGDDFEVGPAVEEPVLTPACAECGKRFPSGQLKRIDGEQLCGRCRMSRVHAARQKKAMMTRVAAVVVLLAGAAALYLFVLKDRLGSDVNNPGGAAATAGKDGGKDVAKDAAKDSLAANGNAAPAAPPAGGPAQGDDTQPPASVAPDSPAVAAPVVPPAPPPSTPPQATLASFDTALLIAVAPEPGVLVAFRLSRDRPPAHEIRVFDLATKAQIKAIMTNYQVDSMAISADGRYLVTAGREVRTPQLRLWDARTLELKAAANILESFGKVGIADDGSVAWCLCPQEGMRFIDTAAGSIDLVRGTHIASAYAEFNPLKKLAAIKCNHTSGQWIDIFDLASRQHVHKLAPGERFGCHTLSPDGSLLAIGFGKRIDLYDTERWQRAGTIVRAGMVNAPQRLLITADNRHVIELPFGADGKTPVVRDVAGGESRPIEAMECIDWAPGRKGQLVVLSSGMAAQSFDVATGKAVP